MRGKDELIRDEERAWEPLHALLHGLDPQTAERPYSEDWTVKDAFAHIACWHAEAAQVLVQLREGTYRGWDEGSEDERNERFHAATRDLPLPQVVAQVHASRARLLEELDLLPEDGLDQEARSWFVDSGEQHYEAHLDGLRRALDR